MPTYLSPPPPSTHAYSLAGPLRHQEMLPYAVHWSATTQIEGEFVRELILTLDETVCQLVMPGNPCTLLGGVA